MSVFPIITIFSIYLISSCRGLSNYTIYFAFMRRSKQSYFVDTSLRIVVTFFYVFIPLALIGCDAEDSFEISNNSEESTSWITPELERSVPDWALSDYLEIEKVELYMSHQGISVNLQGGDVYNDFYFQFQDKNANLYVYDVKEKSLAYAISMEAESINHCNNASFSRIFYEEGDEYPLIYVSNSNTPSYNHVQVYRITSIKGSLGVEKVQEIVLPEANETNNLFATDVIMDNYNGYMYVASKGIVIEDEIGRLIKFRIPDPHNKVVCLTEADILDSFKMPFFRCRQGATIVGNKMFFVAGVPHWGFNPEFLIIDLEKKVPIYIANLKDFGYNKEPESVFLYKGNIFISSNRTGIFKVSLTDEPLKQN